MRRVEGRALPPLPAPPCPSSPQPVLALGPGIKLPALSLLFGLIMSVSVLMSGRSVSWGKCEHRKGSCVRSLTLHVRSLLLTSLSVGWEETGYRVLRGVELGYLM